MAHSHSYINSYGQLNEQLGGLTAIRNMKQIIATDDWAGIAQQLKNLHEKISKQHARFLIHSDSDQTEKIQKLSGLQNRQSAPIPLASVLNLENKVNKSTW